MSRWFIGAETGDDSELDQTFVTEHTVGDVGAVASTNGKGAYKFKVAGWNGATPWSRAWWSPSGLSATTLYAKFYFSISSVTPPGTTNAEENLFDFCDASQLNNGYVLLQRTSGGAINIVIRDNPYTIKATSANLTILANTDYRIDIAFTSHASAGTCSVYLDGVLVASATGMNTIGSAVTAVQFGYFFTTGYTAYFDDVELDTAGIIGASYVVARQFSANGAYNEWDKVTGGIESNWNDTPTSGTNYAATYLAAASQTGLVAPFSSTQSGHGSGTIGSGDVINGYKVSSMSRTNASTATGVTLVGTPTSNSGTAGNNLTMAITSQTGDVVIVTGGGIFRTGVTYGPSTAGYTQIQLQTSGASGTGIAFGAWYKVMSYTPDTTVSVNGTASAGDGIAYTSRVFRMLTTHPSLILEVTPVVTGPTTSTNPNPGSITPGHSGAAVVIAAGSLVNDGIVGVPTNYVSQVLDSANATRAFSTASAHRISGITAATPEDPAAFGSSGNGWSSGLWIAYTIALYPSLNDGSGMFTWSRIAGIDYGSFTPVATGTNSYTETNAVTAGMPTVAYADLSTIEAGMIHGYNSVTQFTDDVWGMVSFTPVPGQPAYARLGGVPYAASLSSPDRGFAW